MGDAYKSLTIRINANTAGFSQGLENIKSAVRATQQDMRRLERASRLDPSSLTLAKARLEGLEASAKASATQFSRMSMQLSQAAKSAGGVDRLKASMKDISLRAGKTRAAYNMVNAELDQFYKHLTEAVAASKGLTFKEAEANVKAVKGDMSQLAALMREVYRGAGTSNLPFSSATITEAIAKVQGLKRDYVSLHAEQKRLNETQALKNIAIDAQLAKAQVTDLARQSAKARTELREMGSSASLRAAVSEAKMLDASIKEASRTASTLDEALKLDPSSLGVAQARAKAFAQQMRLLEDAIKNAETRMKAMGASDVAAIEERFKSTGNAVRIFEERTANAIAKVATLEGKLDALRLSGAPAEEIRRMESRLEAARAKAASLGGQLDHMNDAHSSRTAANEVERLKAQLAGVQAKATEVKSRLGQVGMSVRNFGYSMSATVGAGAIMIGTYAVQSADEIDAAYRNMRKTVNGTEEQFESLKQEALEFSQTHFTSADQILEIEAVGGQLGIAAENLGKFSEVVSSTDIATNMDIETISQNFGQLSNIMNDMDQDIQEGPGSLEAYSDALVRLGNNSAAQEDKIQNVMMRIASMGTISGMSTPDLLALATATAATGQGAEAAGTALSKTFSNLESAVNGMDKVKEQLKDTSGLTDKEIEKLKTQLESGNEKLKAFADVAGMSANEFKKAWNEKPMEAFKAFIEGLQRIDREGGSVDGTLKNLGITSVRQKQTLQGLTQTTDTLNNSLQMSNDAWNGISDAWGDAGDAAREAERKSEGFSGQLQILKNNGQMFAEEFTDSLTPAVSALGDVTKGAADVFGSLPEPVRNSVSAIGALVALSGPLGIFTGSIMSGWSAFKKFATGATDVTRMVKGADGAITMVAGSITKAEKAALEAQVGVTGLAGSVNKLSGMKVLGTAALIAGVGTAASIAWNEYVKWEEWTKKVESAHKTLGEVASEAMGNAADAAEDSESKYVSAGKVIEDYKEYVEDAAEANERLADAIEEAANKTGKIDDSSSTINKYIEKVNNGEKLTDDEFAELSGAISTYTQTTGEAMSATRDLNGDVRILKDGVDLTAKAFKDMADAQINEARRSTLDDMLKKEQDLIAQHKVKNDAAEEELRNLEAQRKKVRELADEWAKVPGNSGINPYTKQLAELEEAIAGKKDMVIGLEEDEKAVERISEMIALLNDKRASNPKYLEGLIAGNEDFYNSMLKSDQSVNSFISALRHAGITATELKDVDLSSVIDDWDGSMGSLVSSLEGAGYHFKDNEKDLLALKQIKIGDKYYYVDDKGSIRKENGKLSKFRYVTIGDKTYQVHDNGTVYYEGEKLSEFKLLTIGDKHYKVYDDGTIRDEEGKIANLASFKIGKKTFYVDDNGTVTTSTGEVKNLQDVVKNLKGNEIKITNNCPANVQAVEALKNKLSNLPTNVPITVTTTYKSKGSAPTRQADPWSGATYANGGYVPAKIIEHADGGYFVDRPTVIGRTGTVTHIAGEAGTEYVAKYASGGVVLPLTNPKMRPWVDAVARQMDGGGGNNYYITLDYKAGDDANRMARDFMRIISSQIGR